MRLQRAMEVALGIYAALSHDDLGREWFDATASVDAEVDELQHVVNTQRQRAAVRAKYGY